MKEEFAGKKLQNEQDRRKPPLMLTKQTHMNAVDHLQLTCVTTIFRKSALYSTGGGPFAPRPMEFSPTLVAKASDVDLSMTPGTPQNFHTNQDIPNYQIQHGIQSMHMSQNMLVFL